MLRTKHIGSTSSAAQNHAAIARVAVDQAAVDAKRIALTAANQTRIAAKCVGAYAVAFVRTFIGK